MTPKIRITLVAVSSVVVLSMAIMNSIRLFNHKSETGPAYSYMTMFYFMITGVMCLAALTILIQTIKKTFTNELNKEMRELIAS